MKRRLTFLYISFALFAGMLLLSVATGKTSVVRNDLSRNIFIPKKLFMPLQVKAAYAGQNMYLRYRWSSDKPDIYHDMLKFVDGKWVRYGASVPGPQPQGIYEDRITMLADDGSVPELEKYGGYVTVGKRMRFFTGEASKKEVTAHPCLSKKKQIDVRKYLPATRRDVDDWSSVVAENQSPDNGTGTVA